MPIINLTELPIRLADESGEVYKTFKPGADCLTIQTQGEEVEIGGVPVDVTQVTSIEGLPEPEEGTYYIVPQPVAKILNRTDLVTPDTGPSAIRDENGKIYAVRRLYSVTSDAE